MNFEQRFHNEFDRFSENFSRAHGCTSFEPRYQTWLVELLNLFKPAWRVILLVAAGVRAAFVEQNYL